MDLDHFAAASVPDTTPAPGMTRAAATLKPIATWYAGTKFRSRAEARWAVLFDVLEIRWEYEREGYELSCGWYLPDFWLRDLDCFAEVKGGTDQWDAPALCKAEALCSASRRAVLLLDEMQVLNPLVRVIATDTMELAATWWCDLVHSVSKGRVWYEFDHNAYELYSWGLSDEWRRACETARSARFEHVPRA